MSTPSQAALTPQTLALCLRTGEDEQLLVAAREPDRWRAQWLGGEAVSWTDEQLRTELRLAVMAAAHRWQVPVIHEPMAAEPPLCLLDAATIIAAVRSDDPIRLDVALDMTGLHRVPEWLAAIDEDTRGQVALVVHDPERRHVVVDVLATRTGWVHLHLEDETIQAHPVDDFTLQAMLDGVVRPSLTSPSALPA